MATKLETLATSQPIMPLPERKAWMDLQNHYQSIHKLHLRNLFAKDPQRGERMTAETAGIFLDYSKKRIIDETITLLIALARESALQSWIDAMFLGEKINITENRAVLHVALRAPSRPCDMASEDSWKNGAISPKQRRGVNYG